MAFHLDSLLKDDGGALRSPPHVEKSVLPSFRYPRKRKMTVGSTLEFRNAFVKRLIQACEECAHIPPPHKGRQQYLAEKLGVAPEAVSKWFKIERLAELLQVDQSWLTFGISPEMDRKERKAHARDADGAVHLVLGMIMLAGGHCGMPSQRDPRAAYVDFYVTMRGSVYPIHVSLARELSRDHFELLLPREYQDVRSIGVIPGGAGKFHYLDLPLVMVDEHKARKAGQIALTVSRVDSSRYVTGADTWPRIKSFTELA
jgi:hypothetical protein